MVSQDSLITDQLNLSFTDTKAKVKAKTPTYNALINDHLENKSWCIKLCGSLMHHFSKLETRWGGVKRSPPESVTVVRDP